MRYKMKDFAAKHGLECGNGCVWGVFGGYHVHIRYAPLGNPRCLVTVVARAEGKEKQLEKFLEANKQKLAISNYGVIGLGLMVCPKFTGEVFARAENILTALTAHLKKAGAGGADVCPYCGQPLGGEGVMTTESDIPFRAHEECFLRALAGARAKDAENAAKPDRKGLGAFGGFLGALFGAVLFVLTYAWWNFGALGGAAGALLAYFLYRKLGGKDSLFAVAYCGGAALLLSLAAFAFGLFMDGREAGGGFSEALQAVAAGGAGTAVFIIDLVCTFLFIAAACAFNYRACRRGRRTVEDGMRRL